jgi:toluene monooxygenase system ferredoxin subunit
MSVNFIDATTASTLTCLKHMWKFNAVNGCGINPDDAQLKKYGVRVENDGTVSVDLGG